MALQVRLIVNSREQAITLRIPFPGILSVIAIYRQLSLALPNFQKELGGRLRRENTGFAKLGDSLKWSQSETH